MAKLQSKMPHEHMEDFDKPWCKAFFESPEYKLLDNDDLLSRRNPPHEGSTTNAFFADTLATPNTVRACIAFHKAASSLYDAETCFLISVGSGTDGHNGIMHGGMVYTILDEIQGMVCGQITIRGLMTGEMTVRYKKYVSTPCVLLARARMTQEQGRKVRTIATLEDGQGTVHAECDGLFIRLKNKM